MDSAGETKHKTTQRGPKRRTEEKMIVKKALIWEQIRRRESGKSLILPTAQCIFGTERTKRRNSYNKVLDMANSCC